MCDGVWYFLGYIAKTLHRHQVKRLRKALEGDIEVVVDDSLPTISDIPHDLPERDVVEGIAAQYPRLRRPCKAILRKQYSPVFNQIFPLTIPQALRRLLLGRPISPPILICHLGDVA